MSDETLILWPPMELLELVLLMGTLSALYLGLMLGDIGEKRGFLVVSPH